MNNYCSHCMAQLESAREKCPVCGKVNTGVVPAHHLLPGTILNGKFYVGEALGEGGFGITYIGRDINLDMKVAIKEFYPNGYVNRSNKISPKVNDSVTEGRRDFFEKGRERFLNEARILAKFSGEPGVVDVRDFFEENNTAYIIMEYLDGVDLKTYLKTNGTLTPEHTLRLMMPIMNSLKKVHAQGLIHRDISPDNIMINGDKVKLLDFGAARTASIAANKSLSVMLKPGYAPEEQYRSKGNQGPWTDIYALCATMYKCITGVTPDDATQRVFSDEVKTPSALNIPIKPEIERAIMRGISVHQVDRYQNIDDLIRGLQGIDVEYNNSHNTVIIGKSVDDDNIGTVSIPNNSDDETVLVTDPLTARVKAKEPTPYIDNNGATEKKPDVDALKKESKKPNIKVIIPFTMLAVTVVVLLCTLLLRKDGANLSADSSNLSKEPNLTVDNSEPQDELDNDLYETEVTKDTEITIRTEATEPDNVLDSVSEQSQATEIVETNDTPKGDLNDAVVMSDDLFDFTFTLDGVVYKLPCDYTDLTQNGWKISGKYTSDTGINGNSYISYNMSKGSQKILVESYNLNGNVKPIKECKIGGITCFSNIYADFTIAKGITTSSTIEEIKNAFGTPGYADNESNYESLKYYADDSLSSNKAIDFWRYDVSDYSSIGMRNFIKTEGDKTDTNLERPEYLNSYKEPTSLVNDITSSIVNIEGDLYQLPAPISCFIDNGWEIMQQPKDVVASGKDYIKLERSGKWIELNIANYASYQTTPENCAVYKIILYGDEDIDFSFGNANNPIKIGTDKAGVDALITEDFKVYDFTSSYSYSYVEYRERDFNMTIMVDKKTEKVSNIQIYCNTWWY